MQNIQQAAGGDSLLQLHQGDCLELMKDIPDGSRAVLDIVQTAFSVYGYIEWGKIDEQEKFKRMLP